MDGTKMITTESRKHPRIKCRLIVQRVGPTVDISAGGVRVLLANPLAEGDEIRLAFQLPESEESVQCHGRVVHVSDSPIDKDLCEMGIQYQRLMTRHRVAIEQYVRQHADDRQES